MRHDMRAAEPKVGLAPSQLRLSGAVRSSLLALAVLGAPVFAHAQMVPGNCGPLQNAYGPLDFRTAAKPEITIVTDHHFPPQVQALIRGGASTLGGDIDYTLRAIPNHPQALLSMMRYGERVKLPQVPGARYTVECYFVRALTFRPDDTTVRMLYARLLNGKGRRKEGLDQLALARQHAGDNGFTHFNIGLFYLELGDPVAAREQALRARQLGFTRPELVDRLRAAGQWPSDAPGVTPAASAAASAAATHRNAGP